MGHNLLNRDADEVPDHEKVESYEQPEHSPTVRHQGTLGVGQLLRLREDVRTVKLDTHYCLIYGLNYDRFISNLKTNINWLKSKCRFFMQRTKNERIQRYLDG